MNRKLIANFIPPNSMDLKVRQELACIPNFGLKAQITFRQMIYGRNAHVLCKPNRECTKSQWICADYQWIIR